MRKLIAVGLVGIVLIACSGGGGSIGASCSSSSGCGAGDFCNQLGVCTRDCTTHTDCGCAPNTTNGDIASGACMFACVNVGTAAVCAKTCATNANCNGSTTCQPAVDSNGTSLGYSECV